jgi:ABC-2 type transport system ATP-binding protein
MSIVELQRVHLHYGRTPVVRNVSLDVEEGASLGLIGPNGCGKSSLMKLIATVLRPTEGQVIVHGFDTRFDARQVRRRIGYVPEQLGIYPGLTVWQFLAFFARCAGVPPIERNTTVETLLRVVDLHDQRAVETQRLSRGMRRRLALARALVHNPSVLLLDDPLGGLDGRGRLELLEVLKELRGMGITVLMSGHLLGDIVQLCSHVGVMREGTLVGVTPVPELIGQDQAERRRMEIEVLFGEEVARALLNRQPDASNIETDGRVVSFTFQGDREGLSTLLDRMLQEGVQLVRFGPGPERFDELAAGLAEANGKAAP